MSGSTSPPHANLGGNDPPRVDIHSVRERRPKRTRQTTYRLTCGADAPPPRKVVDVDPSHPYPRVAPKKHVVPMLPLPLEQGSSKVPAETRSTGCGTTVHVSASPASRNCKKWVGDGDKVGSTVVLLPPEYFRERQKWELGGVPRKEECGCLTVGVGCCVCGNTLGTLTTRCEGHITADMSAYPTFYTFLGEAVSPPVPRPVYNRKARMPVSPTPSTPQTQATPTAATRTHARFDLADWLSESYVRRRVQSPTPSEIEQREADYQAVVDEAAAEDARVEAAVARFHAERDAPTTHEEMRAWTRRALRIYLEVAQRGSAGRTGRMALDR
ncbi:hypothetical protein B0H11DRAFT_2049286 [Mycena galericulata]|nr:hypothetical protein B0H11DRAFT_2049286 [Mycena galericulata]